jgi:hypothetical protein
VSLQLSASRTTECYGDRLSVGELWLLHTFLEVAIQSQLRVVLECGW